MISFYMIITALMPMALAKGSMECNLSGPTGAQQCFGALGEPLTFQLPTHLVKIMLKKNETTIFHTAKNKGIIHDKYMNHSVFFPNVTFKLINARRTDSGHYKLQTYGSNGISLPEINMHLEIQAPVSKPAISQIWLSPERMNISCSSEGDGVEFILTLDGHFLMQTRDFSQSLSCSTENTVSLTESTDNQHKPSTSNVTIGLPCQLTGNLMCDVRNHVSREETVIHLTSCKGSISHFSLVTVAVTASVATLLLHLALFLGIKHLNKKTTPMAVNEDNAEDEIVYSDVRVMKNTRKTRPNLHQNTT